MHLVELDVSSIPFGQPLPFPLRGVGGVLLVNKGLVIRSSKELQDLVVRGQTLYVDTDEAGPEYRSYVARLQSMLYTDKPLGEIANVAIQVARDTSEQEKVNQHPEWESWQLRWTQLLHKPNPATFAEQFDRQLNALLRYTKKNPNAALLALIHLSAQELRNYCATHSMLTAVICTLVAHETLNWPAPHIRTLASAAMGMNLGMAALQDELALQGGPLTAAQAQAIDSHADRSVALGKELGISDPIWEMAVQYHHYRDPGPLAEKPIGRQMARLIQRADIFGARIAPRAARHASAATPAMKACYYDETQAVDEAGAAIVKTLGIYPPGTWVQLASDEIGVVIQRNAHAATPKISVFLNNQGIPCEPLPRDTALPRYKIKQTIAPKDWRVHVSVERLLALL
ncbi:MAG: phosphohydrolase [Comamonas sp.]|nr:phosphohydrolase [Comamonas sp.]